MSSTSFSQTTTVIFYQTRTINDETISTTISIENGQFVFESSSEEESIRIERPISQINIFDPGFYLNSNPDVAQFVAETDGVTSSSFVVPGIFAGTGIFSSTSIDPLLHYIEFGAQEGRDPSPLFDSQYYLEQNSDVATALAGGAFNGDPLLHYIEFGGQEGRDPNPFFDSDYYLASNPDVAEAGLNPLEHYVLFGSAEGRDPSLNFDPDFYLNQNSDVAAAGIDPLTHFLTFGQSEGRLPNPV